MIQPRRALRLSTPYAHGDDVRALQVALNARLRARRHTPITVDGQYGRATAGAVRSVLWALGAPGDKLDDGATIALQRIIRDPKRRPPPWYGRAKQRSQDRPGAATAVAWALAQVGQHEQGFANRGAWVDTLQREFGMFAQPWCGAFVGKALRLAGVPVPDGIVYTPNIVAWAKTGLNGWSWHTTPEKGDLALFKWPGVSRDVCDHVGLVVGDGRKTVEGNTSAGAGGSQNDGGGVFLRDRGGFGCIGYARPPFAA